MTYLLTNTELSKQLMQHRQKHNQDASELLKRSVITWHQWIIDQYMEQQPNRFIIHSNTQWLIMLHSIKVQQPSLDLKTSLAKTDQQLAVYHAVTSQTNEPQNPIYQSSEFAKINHQYDDYCRENRYIDSLGIAKHLKISSKHRSNNPHFYISTQIPYPIDPSTNHMFKPLPNQRAQLQSHLSQTNQQEIEQMVQWCNHLAIESTQPLTIILPNDVGIIETIKNYLHAHLTTGLTLSCLQSMPLGDQPLSKSIMLWISLTANPSVQQIIDVLESPDLDHWIDLSDLNTLKNHRQQRYHRIGDFISQFKHELSTTAIENIKQIMSMLNRYPDQTTLSSWMKYFNERVKSLRLTPKQRPSVFTKIKKLFNQLSKQAFFEHSYMIDDILHIIRHAMRKIKINDHTRLEADIYIMTPTEAIHCMHDHVWVYGWHHHFYPHTLLRQSDWMTSLGLVSTTAHEAQAQLFDHLCQYSHSVTFSSCEHYDQKAVPIDPSIEDIPSTSIQVPVSPMYHKQYQCHTQNKRSSQKIKHPHQLLVDQSHCSFRAYAKHELGLKSSIHNPYPFALTPAEKGQLIHKVLQRFWLKIKCQQTLKDLSDHQETQCLIKIIDDETKSIASNQTIGTQLKQEQHRCFDLVKQWLQVERLREAFSVLHLELPIHAEIAHIKIPLVIDRIDRLEDGRLFIIDYKTYAYRKIHWSGDRLPELQLPLYALATEHIGEIAGLAYAHIHHKGIQMNGLHSNSQQKGLIHPKRVMDVDQPFDELKQYWRSTCESLLDEYLHQTPTASPHFADSCRYCDFSSFCGILGSTSPGQTTS